MLVYLLRFDQVESWQGTTSQLDGLPSRIWDSIAWLGLSPGFLWVGVGVGFDFSRAFWGHKNK